MTAAPVEVSQRVNPPKTRKGKKILLTRESLLVENDKKTMIMKGPHTSGKVNEVLADLFKIRRQNSVMMNQNNAFLPFEDSTALCSLMKKKDTSLFVFGSHNKKRPHNLVFGRTFDTSVLDMIEFGVTSFKKICQFPPAKIPLGAKPALIFNGDLFEREENWGFIQNFFCDFFCTTKTNSINLAGLEYVIALTAVEPNTLLIRSYQVNLKKSGTDKPYVELEEIGVSLDLELRRSKFAAHDVRKLALRIPRAAKIGKTKNVTHDIAGSKLATVHMTKQDIHEMPQSKMKGNKRAVGEKKEAKDKKKAEKEAAKKSRKVKEADVGLELDDVDLQVDEIDDMDTS